MQWPHSTHAQQRLPPPLASMVRSSLFMHVHSSPLSLASRLHWCWCRTNCSRYVNNGWTFFQTDFIIYIYIYIYTHIYVYLHLWTHTNHLKLGDIPRAKRLPRLPINFFFQCNVSAVWRMKKAQKAWFHLTNTTRNKLLIFSGQWFLFWNMG